MPTVRGWAALGVSIALVVLWIVFGETELLAAAIFLLCAVLLGFGFVRSLPLEVVCSRVVRPPEVQDGDEVVVETTLEPKRRLWNLILEDTVHGLGAARFAAARADAGQALSACYEIVCRSRGIYQIGPVQVSVSDPLGLCDRRSPIGNVDRLLVLPRIEDLHGVPTVRGLDSSVQSTRPSYAPRGGEDFFTLREYQTGDDLRRVHWPASAKRDELMIKQLELPWQARALVLIDQRSHRYPTEEAFEHAIRGAASVVSHLSKGGFNPELWTSDRPPQPHSGSRYAQAMEILATVQTVDRLDLRSTVRRLRRHGVGGGAFVAVTGVLDEGMLGVFRALAQDFSRTIVMAVDDRIKGSVASFQRAGAVAVIVGSDNPWAPAWRAAMEATWSTVSAG
jgi:uncharacterized protein (DUF58 family)